MTTEINVDTNDNMTIEGVPVDIAPLADVTEVSAEQKTRKPRKDKGTKRPVKAKEPVTVEKFAPQPSEGFYIVVGLRHGHSNFTLTMQEFGPTDWDSAHAVLGRMAVVAVGGEV